MLPDPVEVAWAVDAAAGRRPGSLRLDNARIVDVFTGAVRPGSVLLAGRLIAGAGPEYAGADADAVTDLGGRWLAPGLIDGHMHFESSLVVPREYCRAVLPRGVTAVVADPHELANVLGPAGPRWLLDASAGLPLDVFVTASSCVPATPLESTGGRMELADIAALLEHPRVVGVAELMNFPAMIAAAAGELAKAALAEARGKVADGHAPLVQGRELQAYFAAGVRSDHEATSLEEGRAKLQAGCFLMVRDASAARNVAALAPLITPFTAGQIGFVTDDKEPHDLFREGGVDSGVRKAIAAGVDPVLALRCATLSPATYFRLPRRGAVAPGYWADLIVLDDLATLQAHQVYKAGRLLAADGVLLQEPPVPAFDAQLVAGTVRIPALDAAMLRLPFGGGGGSSVRAIGLVPHQILTRAVAVAARVADGAAVAAPETDVAKLVSVERHRASGRIGRGLVQGFGLRRGAIASSLAHDNHNLIAAGVDDASLVAALHRCAELGGGFVVAVDGRPVAEVPLPVAGLMSPAPLGAVRGQLDALEGAAQALGVHHPSPFMTLSFLSLAVIPELRLTDHGLVDVGAGRVVGLTQD